MATIDQTSLNNLLELIGGDQASLVELINSFLTEGPRLLASLQWARDEKDYTEMCRAAHTLKSSATDFGALDLARSCATLEAECRNKKVTDANAQVAHIAEQFSEVRSELETLASQKTT